MAEDSDSKEGASIPGATGQLHQPIATAGLSMMRVGGPARRLWQPTDLEQCRQMLEALGTEPHLVLGRGSNTLFTDLGFDGTIVQTTRMTGLRIECNSVWAEAGVSLPHLVHHVVGHSLGGIEYLVSVPGTVGGAVVMNAGRGRVHNQQISDWVEDVECWHQGRLIRLSRKDCGFGYRDSVFQHEKLTVLAVQLRLPSQSPAAGHQLVLTRLAQTQQAQDTGWPNLGSIYKAGFRPELVRRGRQYGGACWSWKTVNWIINLGAAKAHDVLWLMEEAEACHLINGFARPAREIRVVGVQ